MKGRPYSDADLQWVREHSHLSPSMIGQHFGATPSVGKQLLRRAKQPTPGDYQDRGAPACLVVGFDGLGSPYVAFHIQDVGTAMLAAKGMRGKKAVVYVRLDLVEAQKWHPKNDKSAC